MSFRIINPLNSTYVDAREGLYRACVNGDDAEFARCEAKLHGLKQNRLKSPAQQFDESHAKWLKNGREA
jgi:hypothetical protein